MLYQPNNKQLKKSGYLVLAFPKFKKYMHEDCFFGH